MAKLLPSLLIAAMATAFPATARAEPVDPAVIYANAHRNGPIRYKEGWFGEGASRLHYVEAGTGPLIILYHGFPSFWFSWFRQMEQLKSRYRVVAVDGLGAGRSAKPDVLDDYRIDRLASQLDRLARHLADQRRFILIGHDWGAALAFAYAQAYPGRLRALIAMSAPPYNLFLDLVASDPEQQARSAYMQVFRKTTAEMLKSSDIPERIWRQAYGDLLSSGALSPGEGELFHRTLTDPATLNGGMNWYRSNLPAFDEIDVATHWPAGHPQIGVPTLFVWGAADKTFVERFIPQLRAVAPNIRVQRQSSVGHWTPMERPAETYRAIIEFLNDANVPGLKDDAP